MSPSPAPTGPPWTRSMLPGWPPEATTTVRPARAPTTTRTTTAPSSWIQTATTSRPSATGRHSAAPNPRHGSGGQPQRQRCHGEQEEHGRGGERVVACAQVGDEGTDEEQDDADGGGCPDGGGGRPDQWHADADQQPEGAGSFEGGQGGQPRFRHVRLGHGGEDPVIAGDIGRDREGEVGDEQAADNDVRGEHGELHSTGSMS